MEASRQECSEPAQEALLRALQLARDALAIIDIVDAASIAGARGQHFVDEIEILLKSR